MAHSSLSRCWSSAGGVPPHRAKARYLRDRTRTEHDFPAWAEDRICDVLHMGRVRTQRGDGLMFPWEYGETIEILPQEPKFIKRLTFKFSEVVPGRYPFEFYSRLSNEEIIHDLQMCASGQHQLLGKLLMQYTHSREMKYPLYQSDNCVHAFIEAALTNEDNRHHPAT